MPTIPPFVVEYFLLGKTRRDAIERYTQDGGIVTDVWLAFAKDTEAPQRVLVAPSVGVSAVDLGFALHHAITESRRNSPNQAREPLGVSPLENFVAVTIYFDELGSLASTKTRSSRCATRCARARPSSGRPTPRIRRR
jgi:hypothetical protein